MSTVFTMPGKKCPKCERDLPADQFYLRKTGALDSWCRACTRASTLNWKQSHPERVKEISRESDRRRYWADPEKMRAKKLAQYHEHQEAWYARFKGRPADEHRAHWRIHELTRSGRMQRPDTCESCGTAGGKIEAHHPDHSKPESVAWLCTKCHGATRRIG